MPDPTAPPTGTVTFLFTDIEGSTRLWQDDPEAMRPALVEHDDASRDVIAKRRGFVFKHTGDGLAAAFASAGDAVDAAVDAQARLTGLPFRVRMGLHTGEAELRGGDYFGSTVNRCARLMGVARGGQILCSEATAALVRDRDDLVDLGEHRLRDLSRRERVWQVGDGEFGALTSLDRDVTNLRSFGSTFVGRQEELATVADDVAESRLVTLTGVGGVGKTRLAVQAAADLLPRFADGVWVGELAAAANADDMTQVVALALGVAPRQHMTVTESIVDFLRTRQVRMVLDNACGPCGRCRSRRPVPSRAMRWCCSRNGPGSLILTSRWIPRRQGRWWRSADGWTVSRWPSSWPRAGWRR
jgi:class 3 adenylate cyclase